MRVGRGEQLRWTRYAFEVVLASVFELDLGASEYVSHGSGHQHFGAVSLCGDASCRKLTPSPVACAATEIVRPSATGGVVCPCQCLMELFAGKLNLTPAPITKEGHYDDR